MPPSKQQRHLKEKPKKSLPIPLHPSKITNISILKYVFMFFLWKHTKTCIFTYSFWLVGWLFWGVLLVCLFGFFLFGKTEIILYILFCNLLVFYSPMHKEHFSRSPYQSFSFFSIVTFYSFVHVYYFFQLFLSLNNREFSTVQLTSFVYLSLYSKLFSNSKILNSPKIKFSSLEKEKLFSWSN